MSKGKKDKPYCYICHKYIKISCVKGTDNIKEHNDQYHKSGFWEVTTN